MSESRGRKTKKGRWQLTLGVKETIFSLVGIIGLVMMSFALGTLAGRGDIYRVLHNWGFLGPEVAKALQPWNPPQANMSLFAPAGPPALQQPGASLTAPVHPSASAPQQGSISGAFTTPPAAPLTAKKSKSQDSSASRHKMKEEELRRLREEVAKKLKFQNSLDTATYKPSRKGNANSKAKTTATTLVKGKSPDKKSARTKVTDLQKKGTAAALKEEKDRKGRAANLPKTVSAVQSKPKSGGTKLKTKGE